MTRSHAPLAAAVALSIAAFATAGQAAHGAGTSCAGTSNASYPDAAPDHHVYTGQTTTFTVPAAAPHAH